MNILRKLFTGLLIGLLVVSTASAALTKAQKDQVAALIASGASSAQIVAALEAAGVDISSPAEIQTAVAEVVAEVPAADVAAVSQAISQAVVEVAAAAPDATPASVAAVAQAASSGATSGAVTAAAAIGGNVQAAANAAASGASSGAVTAVTSSANTTIAASSSAVAAAASTGASSGASTAAASAGVTVNTTTVATASNTSAASTLTTASTTTTTTTTVPVETGETDGGEEVVVNEVETIFTTSFTLQLSYGSFIVTANSKDNTVTVTPGSGAGTTISSNDGSVNDLTLPNITISTGTRPLNAAQLANLDAQLTAAATTANGGVVVVDVPSNTITVSPSS